MVLRPMQRAIAVAVLTVVALGAVACGGDDELVEPDPTATEAAAPVIETATPFPVLPTTTIVELPTATATSTATATAATGGSHTVVAGDTLFRDSIGRTDLPGGDSRRILVSIREKLLTLDDDVIVIPGHGPQTTIGREREMNYFLRGM